MAGIAIVLDLLRKNPSLNGQSLHSSGLLSSTVAASAAAASIASSVPFAARAFFGDSVSRVAHCDAGAVLDEGYISNIRTASRNIFQNDSLTYNTKEYYIELKPLLSAFQWKTFALTSLRSFLLFYLPLVEPRTNMEDDDEDFLEETPEERHVDLVMPFKKSVKQIVYESTVVTTRRILERLAVHYISQRMAWKLLKDVPKSATRKSRRGMPTPEYILSVSKTTFRGHFLGILASWLVQVGIDVYRFFCSLSKSKEEGKEVDKEEQVKILGKKVYGVTLRCGSSLIFASIGAGIGATMIRPSLGQWIGCALGDLTGPIVVAFCCEKLHIEL